MPLSSLAPYLLAVAVSALPQPRVEIAPPRTLPVLAVIGGRLFLGEAQPAHGYNLRTAIRFTSAGAPAVNCVGNYRLGSEGFDISCDDGVRLFGEITMEDMHSGYGEGRASSGKFAFTYGLGVKAAVRRLAASTGAAISIDAEGNIVLAPK